MAHLRQLRESSFVGTMGGAASSRPQEKESGERLMRRVIMTSRKLAAFNVGTLARIIARKQTREERFRAHRRRILASYDARRRGS